MIQLRNRKKITYLLDKIEEIQHVLELEIPPQVIRGQGKWIPEKRKHMVAIKEMAKEDQAEAIKELEKLGITLDPEQEKREYGVE